jgi:lysozyme family protein
MTSIKPDFDFPQMNKDGSPPDGATPFEAAAAFTFKQEGGHLTAAEAARIGDVGGQTLWGFAQTFNPDIDYSTFTKEQAFARARRDYWDKIRGDDLPPVVSFVLFDYAFNSGTDWANRELQRAIGIEPDGNIGPATLRKLRSQDPDLVARTLLKQRGANWSVKSLKKPQFSQVWRKRLLAQTFSAGKFSQQQKQQKVSSDSERSL